MKYPGGVKLVQETTQPKDIVYGNRGMNLEHDLNITNEYYRDQDIAYIYKKPTPIKITKVNYQTLKITEAFFESPSTTDYNGIYQGKYIDFEAKETKLKTSFPLKNIHAHQIQHMKNIMRHNGICFLIVRFTEKNQTFLLFAKDFFHFTETEKKSSIPYSYFQEYGYLIEEKYHPRVDYLQIVKKYGGVQNGTKETDC